MKSKRNNEVINLIGNLKIKKKATKHKYKAEYSRLLPTMSSSSNLLILYTLYLLNKSSEPLYGKEMLDTIKKNISTNSWTPSHGTHYPVLKHLVKEGFVVKVKSDDNKNYYAITEKGRNEFNNKKKEFKSILSDNYKILANLTQICVEVDDNSFTSIM